MSEAMSEVSNGDKISSTGFHSRISTLVRHSVMMSLRRVYLPMVFSYEVITNPMSALEIG